jgi:hypothetical protein
MNKARILMCCAAPLARQNVTCGDSPRGMVSRRGAD